MINIIKWIGIEGCLFIFICMLIASVFYYMMGRLADDKFMKWSIFTVSFVITLSLVVIPFLKINYNNHTVSQIVHDYNQDYDKIEENITEHLIRENGNIIFSKPITEKQLNVKSEKENNVLLDKCTLKYTMFREGNEDHKSTFILNITIKNDTYQYSTEKQKIIVKTYTNY